MDDGSIYRIFKENTNRVPETKYIKFLDLSNNNLNYITTDVIKHFALLTLKIDDPLYPLSNTKQINLSRLEYLNLDNNNLSSIPSDLFKGMSSVKTISIRRNKLTTLPSRIFHNLDELEKLHLDDNMLESLSGQVFKGLINLHTLSITSNKLDYLDPDVFSALINLRRLFLNTNYLTTLPNKVFHSLKNLEILFLDDNNLKKLNDNLFNKMYRMRRLNLTDNEFTSLPTGIFKSQINLQVLFLDIDKIENLPGSLAVCRNLEILSQKYDENDYSFIQASLNTKYPVFTTGEYYDFIEPKEEISKYKQKILIFEGILFCIECGFENIPADKNCTKCSKPLFYS